MSRLSSGEKQRLAILRTMVNLPMVLLLDEPTSNLDQKFTIDVEELIKEYISTYNACCLIVSHDDQQLQRIADRSYEVLKDCLVAGKFARVGATRNEK